MSQLGYTLYSQKDTLKIVACQGLFLATGEGFVRVGTAVWAGASGGWRQGITPLEGLVTGGRDGPVRVWGAVSRGGRANGLGWPPDAKLLRLGVEMIHFET
jgi:hypothetical protein